MIKSCTGAWQGGRVLDSDGQRTYPAQSTSSLPLPRAEGAYSDPFDRSYTHILRKKPYACSDFCDARRNFRSNFGLSRLLGNFRSPKKIRESYAGAKRRACLTVDWIDILLMATAPLLIG